MNEYEQGFNDALLQAFLIITNSLTNTKYTSLYYRDAVNLMGKDILDLNKTLVNKYKE